MQSYSAALLNLIKASEGFRSKKYRCPAGKWTIGYGHTGRGVAEREISQLRAEELLLQDIDSADRTVRALVKVPINQEQREALISFVFNLGAANLAGSTLLRKLNVGDYRGCYEEFPNWIYVNKSGEYVIEKGLVIRRFREASLFAGVGANLSP